MSEPMVATSQSFAHVAPFSSNRFDVMASMLRDLGTPILPHMKVMDFGCGDGGMVRRALECGFDAYGCDFDPETVGLFVREASVRREMEAAGRMRIISMQPYRLPFDDNSIDVVLSDQVFEHVQNYSEVLAEMKRILKPGGVCLHFFPSRYRLIEGHMHVPFATVFRPRWWFMIWAWLGVRTVYQRGWPASKVVEQNVKWLPEHTNYLPGREIRRLFSQHFQRVEFVEEQFLRYSRRARMAPAALYRTFWARCVYAVR
jgi:SAM-dependent methyltransferase